MNAPVIKARKVEYRRNANGGTDCTVYPNVLTMKSRFGVAVVNNIMRTANGRRIGVFTTPAK